jgi:hypothetical protein
MADPSVTYTFVNGAGNYIDADEVNQNFTDIIGSINSGSSSDLGCGSLKVSGVTLASHIIADTGYLTGSFTATVSGTSSGDTSITVKYEKVYNTVTLFVPEFLANSDGIPCMSLNGLPSAIQPTVASGASGGIILNAIINPTRWYSSGTVTTNAVAYFTSTYTSQLIFSEGTTQVWGADSSKGSNCNQTVIYTLQ